MNNPILCDKPTINTAMSRWGLAGLLSLLVFPVLTASSFAQQAPPPLGPPTYRSEKVQLGVGLLSGFVKTEVAEIVTEQTKRLVSKPSV